MKEKAYRIPGSRIRPLATGRGSCLASVAITVGGSLVGYMYREDPDDELDSGWRFFAGTETQEHAEDPTNFEIYDVNTIANYDPDVIPLLDAPSGSAYERESGTGPLLPIPSPA